MKIYYLSALAICCCFFSSYGQNTFPATGNVGVGTTNPFTKLHVNAGAIYVTQSVNDDYLMFDHAGINTWRTRLTSDNGSSYVIGNDLGGLFNNKVLTLAVNGNVGIGSANPNARLDVDGAILLPGSTGNTQGRPALSHTRITGEIAGYSTSSPLADDGFLRLSAGGGTNAIAKSFIDLSGYSTVPEMRENITLGTAGLERMRITGNGFVGIGTTSPREALSVNGNIRAKEIKVEATNWPDYVFGKNYRLSSLAEIEKHIQEKGHLPGIPSAKEVESTGIDLGDMNAKLLKKIEELTLYLIQYGKEMNAVKAELKSLKEK
jgi:hypothetical protein